MTTECLLGRVPNQSIVRDFGKAEIESILMLVCIQITLFVKEGREKNQYTNNISNLTHPSSSIQRKLSLIPNKKILIQYTKFSQTLLMKHPNI